MTGFRDFFTEHAKGYSRSASHASGNDLKALLEMLSGKSYSRALDIATGTGFTAIAIAPICNEVVALDATEAMLNEARKNAADSPEPKKISFAEGMAESTGLPGSSFDLITCRRAAHHFPDKPAFLGEVVRLLKHGGVFALVDMLSPEQDSGNLVDHLERLRDSSHVHAASKSEWMGLISNSGLEIIEAKTELEERPFDKWLYPVELNSKEGMSCREFVDKNREKLAAAGGWDLESDLFIKQRGIITACKV